MEIMCYIVEVISWAFIVLAVDIKSVWLKFSMFNMIVFIFIRTNVVPDQTAPWGAVWSGFKVADYVEVSYKSAMKPNNDRRSYCNQC